ncbi:MAG: hypothetical protein U0527_13890 [Candidatus Eisenbacteria bacterium]
MQAPLRIIRSRRDERHDALERSSLAVRALLAALLFAGYCACFASWVLAAEDRSTSEIRARQMLERAWAEIDTTTTIEFNDSLALRVGPAPRGASPDSLRAPQRC